MKPHCANCFAPLREGDSCRPGHGCYPPDREAPFERAMLRAPSLAHAALIRVGLEMQREFGRMPKPTISVRA